MVTPERYKPNGKKEDIYLKKILYMNHKTFEGSVQYLSCSRHCTLLDREFWCCSWDLLEPLFQFRGHSSQYSYCHWNHFGLRLPRPLQFLFQSLVFLQVLVFLLLAVGVTLNCSTAPLPPTSACRLRQCLVGWPVPSCLSGLGGPTGALPYILHNLLRSFLPGLGMV